MRLVFFILFLFLLPASKAQILVGKAAIQFEPKAEYFIDSTNSLTINQASKRFFKPYESISFSFKNYNTIWIKINLNAKSLQETQFMLGYTQTFIDSLEVYNVKGLDTIRLAFSDVIHRKRVGFYEWFANPYVPFSINKVGTNYIYIRLRHQNIINFNVLMCDEKLALSKMVSFERFFSIFFGFLMAICLLSMIYFLMSKTLMYLYYALYILFICLYLEAILGNLYIIFSDINDFFIGPNSSAQYGLLAIIFNLLFLEKLFDLKTQASRFHIFKKAIVLILISLFFLNLIYDDLPFSLFIPLLLLFSQICVLFFAYKPKNDLFKLYIIGLIPIFMICIIRILSLLHLIEQPTDQSSFALVAVSFELLILMILQSKVFFESINEKNLLKTQIIKTQIEIQETERRQIASDLHDDLGSTMALIKERVFAETKNLETHELIIKAISDLRAVSRNLLPADFELFGLIPSLEKYISTLNNADGLKIIFIVFGEKRKLKTEIELNIYRILIELIHNIKKHSNASEATVQLIYHAEYLHVSVEEEESIREEIEPNILGIGHKTILSRLEYIKAKVLETGKSNKGYMYVFEVPYI